MAEATDRKVFPMGTFYSYLTGEGMDANKQGIKELLGYMLRQDVDATSELFAAALSKAWIYEQNPELTKIRSLAGKLGDHVSVPQLPSEVTDKVAAIVTGLKDVGKKNADLQKKLAETEKKLSDTQAKLKEADAKVKKHEARLGEGDAKLQVSEKKLDEYLKKLDDLLAKIEEVKKHGVVTAAPGAGGQAAAAEGPKDTVGEVAEDFGFGTVQETDAFGF